MLDDHIYLLPFLYTTQILFIYLFTNYLFSIYSIQMLGSVLFFMDVVAVSYNSHSHGTSNPVEGKDENK